MFDDWHLVVEHHTNGFEEAHAVFALENFFIDPGVGGDHDFNAIVANAFGLILSGTGELAGSVANQAEGVCRADQTEDILAHGPYGFRRSRITTSIAGDLRVPCNFDGFCIKTVDL